MTVGDWFLCLLCFIFNVKGDLSIFKCWQCAMWKGVVNRDCFIDLSSYNLGEYGVLKYLTEIS